MYSKVLIMETQKIHIKLARRRTRAIEFYAHGTPFKPKSVELKTAYKRKPKHNHKLYNLD